MKNPLANKHYSVLVIPGITLGLLVFFLWFLIANIHDNAQKLAEVKSNAVGLEIQNNEIERFKKVYKEYQPNLQTINQAIVDPQNPVDLIKFLETSAGSAQINPKISLQKGIAFQITVTDNFLNILEFLENVEHGPYLLTVDDLIIKNSSLADDKKSGSGKVDASFLIKAVTR